MNLSRLQLTCRYKGIYFQSNPFLLPSSVSQLNNSLPLLGFLSLSICFFFFLFDFPFTFLHRGTHLLFFFYLSFRSSFVFGISRLGILQFQNTWKSNEGIDRLGFNLRELYLDWFLFSSFKICAKSPTKDSNFNSRAALNFW